MEPFKFAFLTMGSSLKPCLVFLFSLSVFLLTFPGSASSLMSIVSLLEIDLSPHQEHKTATWAEDCVRPAIWHLEKSGLTLSHAELTLFTDTPLRRQLETMSVDRRVTCREVGQEIVQGVASDLNQLTNESGVLRVTIWKEELDLSAEEVTYLLVQRDVQKRIFPSGRAQASSLEERASWELGYGE